MTITQLNSPSGDPDALVAENVNTLCHRAKMSGRALAEATGISQASVSRKMAGGTWAFSEVANVADYFGVTLDEIATSLPTREEWEARRPLPRLDSNQQPCDYLHGLPSLVNHRLTADRRSRHLWAVAS